MVFSNLFTQIIKYENDSHVYWVLEEVNEFICYNYIPIQTIEKVR